MNKTLAIIPARGGSKGIPRKNIKSFLGKPLIEYTINLALSIPDIDRVIVSTEDYEIAEISKNAGADIPFMRPKELAQDNSPTITVLRHAVNFLEKEEEKYDNILVLEPTSPLRTKKLVLDTIKFLNETNAETVVSAKKFDVDFSDILQIDSDNYFKLFLDLDTTFRRQDAKDAYLLDGAIYGVKKNILKDPSLLMLNPHKERPNLKTKMVKSDPRVSIEIDNQEDWEYAEYIYKKYKNLIENES